jgi:hypothetical protein
MLLLLFPFVNAGTPASAAGTDIVDKTRSLMDVTERLRGLSFIRDLPVELVDEDRINEVIQRELDEQMSEEMDTQFSAMYSMLGLLPRNASIRDMYQQMVEEQAAGLYDPTDKKFYVVDVDLGSMMGTIFGEDNPLGDFASGLMEGLLEGMGLDMQSAIIVHELTHALDDQHFDIQSTMDYLIEASSDDMQLAYQSLVEGNATRVMNDYMYSAMGMDASDMQGLTGTAEGNVALAEGLMEYPPLIERIMTVPYLKGEEFIRYLYSHGGQEAVDSAFEDPPLSMEQILNPEKYLQRDRPSFIDDPDLSFALNGWRKEATDTLGVLLISLIFELQTGDKSFGDRAADGWDGDRITSWRGPQDEIALAWFTTWDSGEDAQEFFDAYVGFLGSKFPGGTWEINRSDKAVYTGLGLAAAVEIDGRDVVVAQGVPEDKAEECLNELWNTEVVYR